VQRGRKNRFTGKLAVFCIRFLRFGEEGIESYTFNTGKKIKPCVNKIMASLPKLVCQETRLNYETRYEKPQT